MTALAQSKPSTPTPTPSQSKLSKLLDLRRHTDHKVLGVSYVVTFTMAVYYMLKDIDYYETNFLVHALPAIVGVLVSVSALRNFTFLSKKAENPGMFAKNRTFSYAFLKENLWFQVLTGFPYVCGHPLAYLYIPFEYQTLVVFSLLVIRELVPKTSYTSWEVGNNKVNKRSNGWVTFINLQVKIVRWNYVAKKTYLLYLFALLQAEYFLSAGQGSFVSQSDRVCYYLLYLDAMHNITTAFFLQTLKFKGFISAEVFSFLFNLSPLIGVYLTYRLIVSHSIVIPFAIATLVDLFVNLKFIYPSKLSFVWKNRIQVAVKSTSLLLAFYYMSNYA